MDFSSPTYPYPQVPSPNNGLKGSEKIPYMLLLYLLDLPDSNGYQPPNENEYPRARFSKLVWYDDARPLDNNIPTPQEKLSMLFDADNPDINTDEDKQKHPKGYRLLWQKIRGQSVTEAQTLVKCFIGRVFSSKPYHTTIGVNFEITTNVNFETNTKTEDYSRCFAIEQCIRESLYRLNMTGVGAISFQRSDHPDNGSVFVWDDGTLLGRRLHCSIDWVDADDNRQVNCETC